VGSSLPLAEGRWKKKEKKKKKRGGEKRTQLGGLEPRGNAAMNVLLNLPVKPTNPNKSFGFMYYKLKRF